MFLVKLLYVLCCPVYIITNECAHNLSSKPNHHTGSIIHSQLLASTEQLHNTYINILECRSVLHTCIPHTKHKKYRWQWWLKYMQTCGHKHGHRQYGQYRCRQQMVTITMLPLPSVKEFAHQDSQNSSSIFKKAPQDIKHIWKCNSLG